MLKSLFWAAWLFLYFIRKLPAYWKVMRLRKAGKTAEAEAVLDREVTLWAARLFRHIKLNLVVTGRENLPKPGEAVLFVVNHQSYVDIPVVMKGVGAAYPLMAKKELTEVPFLGMWLRALGCITLEREDMRSAAAALREAEELLESGRSMFIFPEGTRSKADDMGEFKPGAVRMATKSGVPVVPIALDGVYKVLEGNHYRVQPATVRMVILPQIPVEGMSREEQRALPERLEALIRGAKDDRG